MDDDNNSNNCEAPIVVFSNDCPKIDNNDNTEVPIGKNKCIESDDNEHQQQQIVPDEDAVSINNNDSNLVDLFDILRCPLSGQLMIDPVYTPSGFTFSATALNIYLKSHDNEHPIIQQHQQPTADDNVGANNINNNNNGADNKSNIKSSSGGGVGSNGNTTKSNNNKLYQHDIKPNKLMRALVEAWLDTEYGARFKKQFPNTPSKMMIDDFVDDNNNNNNRRFGRRSSSYCRHWNRFQFQHHGGGGSIDDNNNNNNGTTPCAVAGSINNNNNGNEHRRILFGPQEEDSDVASDTSSTSEISSVISRSNSSGSSLDTDAGNNNNNNSDDDDEDAEEEEEQSANINCNNNNNRNKNDDDDDDEEDGDTQRHANKQADSNKSNNSKYTTILADIPVDLLRNMVKGGDHFNAVTNYIMTELRRSLDSKDYARAKRFIQYGGDIDSSVLIAPITNKGPGVHHPSAAAATISIGSNMTLLHIAARDGQLELAKQLLFHFNADPNKKMNDKEGMTPLHIAVEYGQVAIVDLFISYRRVNLDLKDANNNTPLKRALLNKQLVIAEKLVRAGANLIVRDSPGSPDLQPQQQQQQRQGQHLHKHQHQHQHQFHHHHHNHYHQGRCSTTFLHYALAHGYIDLARAMIEVGASLDARDKNNQTPLDVAFSAVPPPASTPPTSIIAAPNQQQQQRKQQGPSPKNNNNNNNNNNGVSAAGSYEDFSSISRKRFSKIRLAPRSSTIHKVLLDVASTQAINNENDTAATTTHNNNNNNNNAAGLMTLTNIKRRIRICLELGADCQHTDNRHGFQLIHWASIKGLTDLVMFLVEAVGVDVNARSFDGTTPLHLAALNGHEKLVKFLVDRWDCDVHVPNSKQSTPLHFACAYQYLQCVAHILARIPKSADIDSLNSKGLSPLHMACQLGDLEMAKMLIEKGANINAIAVTNFGKKTCLEIATDDNRNRELIRYLRKLTVQEQQHSLLNNGGGGGGSSNSSSSGLGNSNSNSNNNIGGLAYLNSAYSSIVNKTNQLIKNDIVGGAKENCTIS